MAKFKYNIGDDCVKCGLCIRFCPKQAISKEEKTSVIDQEKCVGCGSCFECCPVEAITKEAVG